MRNLIKTKVVLASEITPQSSRGQSFALLLAKSIQNSQVDAILAADLVYLVYSGRKRATKSFSVAERQIY